MVQQCEDRERSRDKKDKASKYSFLSKVVFKDIMLAPPPSIIVGKTQLLKVATC